MVETEGTIADGREEFMVPPTGGSPALRIGHFLKPSVTTSIEEEERTPFFPVSEPNNNNRWPSKRTVFFNGWRNPSKNWSRWVDRMQSQYHSVWDRAGIHQAILTSTYKTRRRDTNSVCGVAEKWCPHTNTFAFSWGEATITLEDMVILGGFSVLGHCCVSLPPLTEESEEIREKLMKARLEVTRTKHARASQSLWTEMFMESGSEIEHQAFLALWLSRFVFPAPAFDTISKHVFPIAIHLTRGTRIALAPAVLATLYRDLSLLRRTLVCSNQMNNELLGCKEDGDVCVLWAPFQLVQIWAWERFPTLRPNPNPIENGEPRLAQWHGVNMLKMKFEDVKLAIDNLGGGVHFSWRPYAMAVNYNPLFQRFYSQAQESSVIIGPGSGLDDEGLESLVRCLRVSELVGLSCCVEQYLPHRVAMQFGMDQDIPGNVVRSNSTPHVAWENYVRPIREEKLYIPPRLFESGVTSRYLEWWKNSMSALQPADHPSKGLVGLDGSNGNSCSTGMQQPIKSVVGTEQDSSDGERNLKRKRQSEGIGKKNLASVPQSFVLKMEDNGPLVPPGLSPKFSGAIAVDDDPGVSVPPGFPPRCIKEEVRDSVDEDELTLGEFVKKTRGGKNKPRKGSRLQNPPVSSTANKLSLQSMELMMKFMKPVELKKIEKSTQHVMEGSEIVTEDVCDKSTGAGTAPNNKLRLNSNQRRETFTYPTGETQELDLKARIINLEKEVAKLKAEIFANRSA